MRGATALGKRGREVLLLLFRAPGFVWRFDKLDATVSVEMRSNSLLPHLLHAVAATTASVTNLASHVHRDLTMFSQ
jgi:hypothetical protein